MKKRNQLSAGVTLLEVMLVLAIAAMIIVMSTRYYQSATASQQANSILQMIQAVTANADGLSLATGTYNDVTTSSIRILMPNASMGTPWGTEMTVAAVGSNSAYAVTIPAMPVNVCAQLKSRLQGNSKYTNLDVNTCETLADFTYRYDSTK